MDATPHLFQRRRLHAVRQGDPGPQGLAPRLCAHGGARRLADAYHADLAGFIEAQTSVFLATANADGQPYIQHRGGPPGFLRVLDDKTIGFADFAGNRQYITLGNLADNPKAHLFLIDYAHRRRIKIWGEARVVEGDAELIARLMPDGYKARPEQVILFTVSAWDVELPAAHSAALRGRRCRGRARRARPAHRRARGGGGKAARGRGGCDLTLSCRGGCVQAARRARSATISTSNGRQGLAR